jgi:hypothetical protein
MQLALGITGFLIFVSILLFFPETSHPGARGIDKLRLESPGAASPIFVNPFRCLWLLRSPNFMAVVGSFPLVFFGWVPDISRMIRSVLHQLLYSSLISASSKFAIYLLLVSLPNHSIDDTVGVYDSENFMID